jgi:hypothetical protein
MGRRRLTREQMEEMGMSEREIAKEFCEHDFGGVWMHTFMGCTQTCRKCGLMYCDPNHCGQYSERRGVL